MNNKNFEVITKNIGQLQLLELRNNKTQEYVSILPEMGGMLFQLELLINNNLTPLLDTYSNAEELIETLGGSFKGSFLFPFPNRIDAGKYNYNNADQQLEVNFSNENNAIHGLLFDKPFKLTSENESEEEVSIELTYISDGKLKGYPFNFEVTLTITLSEINGLTIKSSAKNTDTSSIPVGFGWHPYFTLNTKVDNLELEFPSIGSFEVNERMLPTSTTQPYKDFNHSKTINKANFDTCFSFQTTDSIAETKLFSPELQGGISVWQKTGNEGCNFVQIYTPDHRNSIAIEPMTCIANAFNNKIGLIDLNPGMSTKNIWGVKSI